MKLKVYSVFDVKAGVYATPFFQLNDGVAVRSFTDMVNNSKSTPFLHAGDYSLLCIGLFDDDSGVISSHKPINVVNGATVKQIEDPRQTKLDLGNYGGPIEIKKNSKQLVANSRRPKGKK